MLITISGMVGSGKSTTARLVVELLAGAGLKPRYLRFRYLKLFGFASRPNLSPPAAHERQTLTQPRASGFRLKPLTAALTAGYITRIIAFRLSGVGTKSRCDVLDRYFYDNLVHYQLTGWHERLYTQVLRFLIPTPNLSILVVASDETLAARRAEYAPEYLMIVRRRYEELPALFPSLVRIATDTESPADEQIQRAVQALVARMKEP